MSENLDLVRSIFAVWEGGDWLHPSASTWASLHPDFECVIADGPEPETWVGVRGVSEGVRDFLGAWDDFRMQADEYRELDAGRVLVLFRRSGQGKHSGVEVAQFGTTGACIFHIRDGLITRLIGYYHRDRALADLGLTE